MRIHCNIVAQKGLQQRAALQWLRVPATCHGASGSPIRPAPPRDASWLLQGAGAAAAGAATCGRACPCSALAASQGAAVDLHAARSHMPPAPLLLSWTRPKNAQSRPTVETEGSVDPGACSPKRWCAVRQANAVVCSASSQCGGVQRVKPMRWCAAAHAPSGGPGMWGAGMPGGPPKPPCGCCAGMYAPAPARGGVGGGANGGASWRVV